MQDPQNPTTDTSPTWRDVWGQSPRELQFAAVLLLGMAGFVVYDQMHWWGVREDYSFGYLVPFFVGYVLFERWEKIKSFLLFGRPDSKTPQQPVPAPEAPWLGRAVTVLAALAFLGGLLSFGLGAFLFGASGNHLIPGTQALAVGLAGCILSAAFLFSEKSLQGQPNRLRQRIEFAGLFVFPALIWLLSAPMLNFLEKAISLFLLHQVTVIVFNSFDLLGFPLERQGNVLILEKGSVGVEDACSGIRSLMACLFAGSFLAAVFLDRLWKKVLLVACAMFFAFVMNIFRSLFLTAWAYLYGSEAIAGKVHDVTGYAVLIFTSIGLLILLPIFNFRFKLEHR